MAAKKSSGKKTAKKRAVKKSSKKSSKKSTSKKRASKKKASVKSASAQKKPQKKPIELYYWPTPNGWKISIMLEECRLPYEIKPVNIGRGEQFKPSFLAISPNNRMPAIVDPQGPGNKPISIFESGAILQYLGLKTGKFYPKNIRGRFLVDQWLFWQMGGLGPMAGQAHHFRQYAPKYANEDNPYAIKRYTDEVNRLYGVMNTRLKEAEYLADSYSIADMACWGWVLPHSMQGQDLDEFPHLQTWFKKISDRPAVQRGFAAGRELRASGLAEDSKEAKKARKVLFGQRAR